MAKQYKIEYWEIASNNCLHRAVAKNKLVYDSEPSLSK